jgi:tetratricopeptide (TPR) repeat protein
VWRWERGVEPDADTQQLIAAVLGVSAADRSANPWPWWIPVGDVLCPELPWTPRSTVEVLADALRSDGMDRRRFMIFGTTALTASAHNWLIAEPALAAAASGRGGRTVTSAMVERLERRIDELRHLDDEMGSASLHGVAVAELRLIHGLLDDGSYTEQVGRRLAGCAADLGRLSAWLAVDSGRQAAAGRLFLAALRAAADSGDALLGANCLGFMAIQAYTYGDPRDAVTLANTGLAALRHRPEPTVEAILHTRAARAYAHLGQASEAQSSMGRAFDRLADGPGPDQPTWAYWITAPELHMAAASSYADVGKPALALREFDAAAGYDDGTYVRTGALYQARIAAAQLEDGNVEAACDTGQQALELLSAVASSRAADQVKLLTSAMRPHRAIPAVADLLEHSRLVLSNA